MAAEDEATTDALGLSAGYDAANASTTVSQVTTLGYYDLDTESIYVRGNDLTPAVRVVLAHELTHALQHQHFVFDLGGPNDLGVRAVVEADTCCASKMRMRPRCPRPIATKRRSTTAPTPRPTRD